MDNIINWFSSNLWTFFDGVITLGTLIIVTINLILNKRKEKLQNQEIKIFFIIDNKKKDTKLTIIRKHFTRSEVLGIVGILQKDISKRFNIEYMKNKKFLDDVIDIQQGKKDEIDIQVTNEELEQFSV